MATDKQLAANRRNALKSTGPRTPEGKAISSRNHTRHDLSDRGFILSSECPQAFEKFLQTFYEEYAPSTPTETTLVDTMAIARWRLIRFAGFEAEIVDHENQSGNLDAGLSPLAMPDAADTPPVPIRSSLSWRRAADSGRSIETMSRAESRLTHQFNGALDRLQRFREGKARLERLRDQPRMTL